MERIKKGKICAEYGKKVQSGLHKERQETIIYGFVGSLAQLGESRVSRSTASRSMNRKALHGFPWKSSGLVAKVKFVAMQ
jgi:hypothetical protein